MKKLSDVHNIFELPSMLVLSKLSCKFLLIPEPYFRLLLNIIWLQGTPTTPPNSHSSSVSDQSAPLLLSEEFNSGAGHTFFAGGKELRGNQKRVNSYCIVKYLPCQFDSCISII